MAVLASATDPTTILPPKPPRRTPARGTRAPRRRRRRGPRPGAGEDRPVEELAPGDAELVEVDRLVDRGRRRRRGSRAPCEPPDSIALRASSARAPALAGRLDHDSSSAGAAGSARRRSRPPRRRAVASRGSADRSSPATAPSPGAPIDRERDDRDDGDGDPHGHVLLQLEEDPVLPGHDEVEAGAPEERTEMTSTAHIITKIVKIAIANFRSFGLWDGFLSTNGASMSRISAMPGMGTPAIMRVEHREQFLQPEEVPRCLRRVGRLVEVGEAEQRRRHQRREDGERGE